MGLLAEGKSRRKISQDPNNTKWTRDTNTFGQKILRAQGWQPGQFLGAQDAPHAELHSAASASYIRVALKDDMKGLGFNRAKEDEVTGLDVFQDLLSRLNGKSEDAVQEDQNARMAVKTHHYVEQRWGPMRFVKGGLLVGDDMRELTIADTEDSSEEPEASEEDAADRVPKKEKKSKKRKALEEDVDSSSRETESKNKKRRKEERKTSKDNESTEDEEKKAKKKEKKSKKDKSRLKEAKPTERSVDETGSSEEKAKKRKSKSKDKARSAEEESEDGKTKEKKSKDKKEKKKRRKDDAEASDSPALDTPMLTTGTSTPTGTGTSTPQSSRNFVRSRFIAQKRQAVLDTKALAQIFMVKA